MRMCSACQEGRHWDCGMQSWCECDCDPEAAEIDEIFNPDSAFAESEDDWDSEDYEDGTEWMLDPIEEDEN